MAVVSTRAGRLGNRIAIAAVIVVTRRRGRRHATAAARRVILALAARLDGHGHDVLQ